ncbi:MAG: bifunctional helix-turn-helix domain-containing protein/methylated-DNA--[protein]-cysteine S-methyltransferase [Phormidesmis sp.]
MTCDSELEGSETWSYRQMERAIAFMRSHHLEQPDLETIAAHVHLSKYHFQRLFTQWAGISPKRFSQYLTIEYAKEKIKETQNLLTLTNDVGLSSPGRLHDLFVSLEAMSPGEYKAQGAGLRIVCGIHQTPFGRCLIAKTARGICNLYFLSEVDEQPKQIAERYLRPEWAEAELVFDLAQTKEVCDRIFALTSKTLTAQQETPLALHVKGTNFQIQVWRALLRIPTGGRVTYRGLAETMGRPTAARAVGTAVGRNPVGYLIPCHRVIRGTGELGGYRWQPARKAAMLGWESSFVEREKV